MTADEVLLVEARGEVLCLTLNRPARANAIDSRLQAALLAAIERAAGDDAVRAVLLSAAGDRVFSAGADLKELESLGAEALKARNPAENLRSLLDGLLALPKPLVCSVQGKAVGAGWMVALCADRIVASSRAGFGMPEIALGMPTPVGAVMLEPRCGPALARQLVQTGDTLDAAGALAQRLVDVVAEPAGLAERSMAEAQAAAARAGHAYAGNKEWLNAPIRERLAQAAAFATRLRERRARSQEK